MASELVTLTQSAKAAAPPASPIDDAHRLVDAPRGAKRPVESRQHRRSVLRLIDDEANRTGLVALPIFLSDVVGLAISSLVGIAAAWLFTSDNLNNIGYLPLGIALPVVVGNFFSGLYPGVGLNPVVEFRQQSRVVMVTYIAMSMILLLTGGGIGTQVFLAAAFASQFAAGPIARAFLRANCKHCRWWGYPALVLGGGEASTTVISNLLDNPAYGLRPIAVLDQDYQLDATRRDHVMGVPVVGTLRLASTLSRRVGSRYAIVALPDLSRADSTRVLERYAEKIPHVLITSAISPFAPGLPILWRDARDFAGVAGVEVRNRLLEPAPKVLKRTMDIVLCVMGMIALLPVFAVLAALIKVGSRGPICFGSRRIGRDGRVFKAWKFRTMIPNAEAVLMEYLATNPVARREWELERKLKDDPRVTKIGAFLRKTSLDELPQLWNVLVGEMSLVGPRPMLLDEEEKYGRAYRLYREVRPGITGLWQVSGRSETSYEERVGYVVYYVRNWSPWLDIHILVRTVNVLIKRRGAY